MHDTCVPIFYLREFTYRSDVFGFTDAEVLNEWMNCGCHPLVMMDANGELDDPQLDDFIQDYNLYDLIAKSNDGDAPRTYQRSGRRLDYMLGDEHILASIVKSGSLGSGDGDLRLSAGGVVEQSGHRGTAGGGAEARREAAGCGTLYRQRSAWAD